MSDEPPESTATTRWVVPLGIAWTGFLLSAWVYTKKLDEQAQRASPKLLIAFLGTPVFSVLLLIGLRWIARPAATASGRTGDLLITWVTAFLFCIHASVLAEAIDLFPLHRAVPIATAILMLGLAPLLHTLEPKSPMGIRTKRTLESEEVWRKTHVAAAKMFAAAGLIGLSALFFEGPWVMFSALVPAIFAVVCALIYAAALPKDSAAVRERSETEAMEGSRTQRGEQEADEARPSDDGSR